jgi:hypothetical protein
VKNIFLGCCILFAGTQFFSDVQTLIGVGLMLVGYTVIFKVEDDS